MYFHGVRWSVMALTKKSGLTLIPDTSRITMQTAVRNNLKLCSAIFTDEHASYQGLGKEYAHLECRHSGSRMA
jgi:hypothetical protein